MTCVDSHREVQMSCLSPLNLLHPDTYKVRLKPPAFDRPLESGPQLKGLVVLIVGPTCRELEGLQFETRPTITDQVANSGEECPYDERVHQNSHGH